MKIKRFSLKPGKFHFSAYLDVRSQGEKLVVEGFEEKFRSH